MAQRSTLRHIYKKKTSRVAFRHGSLLLRESIMGDISAFGAGRGKS